MPNEKLEVLEGRAAGKHIDVSQELIIGRGSDEINPTAPLTVEGAIEIG